MKYPHSLHFERKNLAEHRMLYMNEVNPEVGSIEVSDGKQAETLEPISPERTAELDQQGAERRQQLQQHIQIEEQERQEVLPQIEDRMNHVDDVSRTGSGMVEEGKEQVERVEAKSIASLERPTRENIADLAAQNSEFYARFRQLDNILNRIPPHLLRKPVRSSLSRYLTPQEFQFVATLDKDVRQLSSSRFSKRAIENIAPKTPLELQSFTHMVLASNVAPSPQEKASAAPPVPDALASVPSEMPATPPVTDAPSAPSPVAAPSEKRDEPEKADTEKGAMNDVVDSSSRTDAPAAQADSSSNQSDPQEANQGLVMEQYQAANKAALANAPLHEVREHLVNASHAMGEKIKGMELQLQTLGTDGKVQSPELRQELEESRRQESMLHNLVRTNDLELYTEMRKLQGKTGQLLTPQESGNSNLQSALDAALKEAQLRADERERRETSYIKQIEGSRVTGWNRWFTWLKEKVTGFDPTEQLLRDPKQRLSFVNHSRSILAQARDENDLTKKMELLSEARRSLYLRGLKQDGTLEDRAPIEAGDGGIGLAILKADEEGINVTKDVVVDTTLTVGTLGGSALANLGRKGAQVAVEQVAKKTIVELAKHGAKEGAQYGAAFGAGASVAKNAPDVYTGDKSMSQAAKNVSVDTVTGTVVGAGLGAGINVAAVPIGKGLRAVGKKIDELRSGSSGLDAAAGKEAGAVKPDVEVVLPPTGTREGVSSEGNAAPRFVVRENAVAGETPIERAPLATPRSEPEILAAPPPLPTSPSGLDAGFAIPEPPPPPQRPSQREPQLPQFGTVSKENVMVKSPPSESTLSATRQTEQRTPSSSEHLASGFSSSPHQAETKTEKQTFKNWMSSLVWPADREAVRLNSPASWDRMKAAETLKTLLENPQKLGFPATALGPEERAMVVDAQGYLNALEEYTSRWEAVKHAGYPYQETAKVAFSASPLCVECRTAGGKRISTGFWNILGLVKQNKIAVDVAKQAIKQKMVDVRVPQIAKEDLGHWLTQIEQLERLRGARQFNTAVGSVRDPNGSVGGDRDPISDGTVSLRQEPTSVSSSSSSDLDAGLTRNPAISAPPPVPGQYPPMPQLTRHPSMPEPPPPPISPSVSDAVLLR